jgi:xanthine dehydrogenase accessory factor
MTDLDEPLCVRRTVSFCTALAVGHAEVEGVAAVAVRDEAGIVDAWSRRRIAVLLAGDWDRLEGPRPDVVVDARLAKRNLGTRLDEAPLVVALGPGFEARVDCHLVIETDRGHDLGRIIESGTAAPDTGVPGDIAGHTAARVLRAPVEGVFQSWREIGDRVTEGEAVGEVAGMAVRAGVTGVLRGLIGTGTRVTADLKIGDVDPRAQQAFCHAISDKARALSGSVLEGVLRGFNRPPGA